MPTDPDQLHELLRVVAHTRDHELSCDECLAGLAEFVEADTEQRDSAVGYTRLREHLNVCPECREELAVLLAALGQPRPRG